MYNLYINEKREKEKEDKLKEEEKNKLLDQKRQSKPINLILFLFLNKKCQNYYPIMKQE